MSSHSTPKRTCLICGIGQLPEYILQNVDISCVIKIDDGVENTLDTGTLPTSLIKYTQVGKLLSFLKSNNADSIVFAGRVRRPVLSSLVPDRKGVLFLLKVLIMKNRGDDNLLSAVGRYFANQGVELLSIKDICPDLFLATLPYPKRFEGSIKIGTQLLRDISSYDIAQSLVVNGRRVIAIEGFDGTDALIKRCKPTEGSILIKLPKVTQSKMFDLPTIGLDTLQNMRDNNFIGIVISPLTIVLQKEAVFEFAKDSKIFISSIDI